MSCVFFLGNQSEKIISTKKGTTKQLDRLVTGAMVSWLVPLFVQGLIFVTPDRVEESQLHKIMLSLSMSSSLCMYTNLYWWILPHDGSMGPVYLPTWNP